MEQIELSDIKMSSLKIIQGTSDESSTYVVGTVVDYVKGVEIAKPKEVIEFIMLVYSKNWQVRDANDKILRVLPAKRQDEYEWEGVEDGQKVKRIFTYNFIGLVSKNGVPVSKFPMSIMFQKSFIKTAQVFLAQLAENKMDGIGYTDYVYNFSSFEHHNRSKNKWQMWKVSQGRQTTDAEKKMASAWLKKISGEVEDQKLIAGSDVN